MSVTMMFTIFVHQAEIICLYKTTVISHECTNRVNDNINNFEKQKDLLIKKIVSSVKIRPKLC